MERYDFITTREEVLENIETLYSYMDNPNDADTYEWASGILKNGRIYITDIIDSKLYFAPSRFVGYTENTVDKHKADPGHGTQTNNKLTKFYREVQDVRLDAAFQTMLSKYGLESSEKKYWIPKDMTVEQLFAASNYKSKQYWVGRVTSDDYWDIAIDNHLWLTQQRYGQQDSRAVSRILGVVSKVKVSDVILLTYGREIYAYGNVIPCPFDSEQLSSLQNVVYDNKHDYTSGIVKFSDSETFYEDLRNGDDKWGQRIIVDQWHYYLPQTTVTTENMKNNITDGVASMSFIGVNEEFALNKIAELKKQYEDKNMFVTKVVKLLQKKNNIILQGAPGTGKTYNTAAIALSALGINDVDLTDHEAVMEKYELLQNDRIFFTTFHQSLDYEDFVEGLKPQVQTDKNGNSIGVVYEPEDGIFKRACQAVQSGNADENKSVVLIIDEINRGNVSKVFGELITLLESDKRDNGNHPIKVLLPYSKTLFGVPSNLYIIGTMNTTDRSTGTLDYALRRRFAFVTLKSDPRVVEQYYSEFGDEELKVVAVKLFNNIKEFIEDPKHLCGDLGIDDLMVGHSYFMADGEDEFREKIEYEVIPLISEYINDGILNVRTKERDKFFAAWRELKPVEKKIDEQDDNDENND